MMRWTLALMLTVALSLATAGCGRPTPDPAIEPAPTREDPAREPGSPPDEQERDLREPGS